MYKAAAPPVTLIAVIPMGTAAQQRLMPILALDERANLPYQKL